MTDAYDLLMEGEYLRAVIDPFTRITGEPFFYGFLLLSAMLVIYLQTGNIGIPLMIFLVVSVSLMTSHLVQFAVNNAFIPQEFQTWAYIVVTVAFAGVILYVWWKK